MLAESCPVQLQSTITWEDRSSHCYINSFLNPLIYAKFNREFRLPFRLILLCQCRDMNARLRSAAFSAQYGLPTGGSRRMSSTNRSVSNRVNRRSLLERPSTQRPQPSATQARL
ncbi:hypothetical protein P879_00070 [Paragonimus westermani]|uniref:G-protein coupled receptors family 1 profile domain-containing protein n=1 Tax=Paragonimus westermani TaxID=34504 RepID=A0A8T0DZ26_9TREM|nr:hypothetical protein P879_00070 [Paragonimus westermani]